MCRSNVYIFELVLNCCLSWQFKYVLFELVRKTQYAMFFKKFSTEEGEMWIPCGPRQAGAVQTTMQELAAEGLAAKVLC